MTRTARTVEKGSWILRTTKHHKENRLYENLIMMLGNSMFYLLKVSGDLVMMSGNSIIFYLREVSGDLTTMLRNSMIIFYLL